MAVAAAFLFGNVFVKLQFKRTKPYPLCRSPLSTDGAQLCHLVTVSGTCLHTLTQVEAMHLHALTSMQAAASLSFHQHDRCA
jgi:hypothetical protein